MRLDTTKTPQLRKTAKGGAHSPILAGKCSSCHGPDDKVRKAGLRLDLREAALKELRRGGRAIVPGDPAHSELLRRVASADAGRLMPPRKVGKPLSEAEIAILRNLEVLALKVRRSGTDKKWEELSALLQNQAEMFDAHGHRRKLVLFTEHRDTLNYLGEKLRGLLGRAESVVTVHGGIMATNGLSSYGDFTAVVK